MKNESTSESLKAIANKANGKVGEMAKKSTEIVKKSKKAVYDAVDVNGDGQVDIEDVILLAFKVPGVAVKRDVFLKQELMGKCSRENVDSVVEGRSLYEVIDTEKIDKIAKSIWNIGGVRNARGCCNGGYNSYGYSSILWMFVACCTETYVSVWIFSNRV